MVMVPEAILEKFEPMHHTIQMLVVEKFPNSYFSQTMSSCIPHS